MPSISVTELGVGAVFAILILKEVFAFVSKVILKFKPEDDSEKSAKAMHAKQDGYNKAIQEQMIAALGDITRGLEEMTKLIMTHVAHMEEFRTDFKQYLRENRDGISKQFRS